MAEDHHRRSPVREKGRSDHGRKGYHSKHVDRARSGKQAPGPAAYSLPGHRGVSGGGGGDARAEPNAALRDAAHRTVPKPAIAELLHLADVRKKHIRLELQRPEEGKPAATDDHSGIADKPQHERTVAQQIQALQARVARGAAYAPV